MWVSKPRLVLSYFKEEEMDKEEMDRMKMMDMALDKIFGKENPTPKLKDIVVIDLLENMASYSKLRYFRTSALVLEVLMSNMPPGFNPSVTFTRPTSPSSRTITTSGW